jgi:thiol-disulfide isomerase/thioredoxin
MRIAFGLRIFTEEVIGWRTKTVPSPRPSPLLKGRGRVVLCNVFVLSALALAGEGKALGAAPGEGQDILLSHTLQAEAAEGAWTELEKSAHPPETPAAWRQAPPTKEEQEKFMIPYVLALEDRAKNFYTRFPKDGHVLDCKLQELQFISIAMELGATNEKARLDGLETALLSETNLPANIRFGIRKNDVMRNAQAKQSEGEGASLAEFEKGIRVLQNEFPGEPEVEQMLLEVASLCDGQKARGIVKEIAGSKASSEVKEAAAELGQKLERVGQVVELQFAAVDGREVDLAKMKGKVVLVDFWATWCGPCVREVPNVVATYNELHPKGFEIAGISLDTDRDSLAGFVAEHKMGWPQYFDGRKWQNKIARQFDIDGVPSMWLVDKQGKLRDINGHYDLGGKVEKLLAE